MVFDLGVVHGTGSWRGDGEPNPPAGARRRTGEKLRGRESLKKGGVSKNRAFSGLLKGGKWM